LQGGRTLTLSRADRFTRLVLFGLLAFSGSLLLGQTYLPTIAYFWALGMGRLLLSIGFVYLPMTDAGRFRPLLLMFALGGLACFAFFSTLIFAQWVLVTLLYVSLEVAMDCLVLISATEQEVPFELGWLAAWRLLGLWVGIFIQYSDLSGWTGRLTLIILMVLACFWAVSRENSSDRFLPRQRIKAQPSALERLTRDVRSLSQPWSLAAAINLFCYAILTGFCTGAILPYPLLHPQAAGMWLQEILPNLQVLGVGILVMFFAETRRLRTQLVLVSLVGWGLLLPGLVLGDPISAYAWGLLLTGTLVATRVVLRECYKVDPVLRAAVIVTVWTCGGLLGEQLERSLSESFGMTLQVVIPLVIAAFASLGWRRYGQEAKAVLTAIPDSSRLEARFGDRTQDFGALPTEPVKKSKPGRWRGRLTYLLVHLPVYLITIGALIGSFRVGSYIVHNRSDWERRLEDTKRTFKTELFFNSFARRLTEELLASQRVPDDWGDFIGASFQSTGVPLSDIDFWGTPYLILSLPGKVVIVSAGPDRELETADDLSQEVRKPVGVR
jgi:hypothetical protein